ncbi:MAG: nitrous oxide reductase accessory protein NosL [Ignavibacteriae bacterium]|nr:nitrous oxide reductase accessory protein NosL [Ignavibacteriota bacterium]
MNKPDLFLNTWDHVVTTLFALLFVGCAASDLRPVDIYPEDNCSNCRMAISEEQFASQIITEEREVFKFDDIGCLEKFKGKRPDLRIAAIYYKDYEAKQWVPSDRVTIVETDVITPMSSGKIAFGDADRAREFAKKHPPKGKATEQKGCGMSCCAGTDE